MKPNCHSRESGNPDPAGQLLAHFDRIADTPDAIPRLRRFILDLAVRGKLVPQDPNDEPASELLKRIAAEKTRLVKAGEIKNQSDLPLVATCETPFSIPDTWKWTRIGSTAYVEMGQSPPSEHYNRTGHGIPFFQGKADFGKRYPTARYWCTQPKKYAAPGDILISVRAPVGPTNVASELCCIGRGLAALRPHDGIDRDYLLRCLEAFELVLNSLGFGTTFVAINKNQLASFVIPLPPLAEQHRIVAKVDELMALCDHLEATRMEREATRDRMATASLARLDAPDPDPATFQNHAVFALNNLTPLTTRPDQIKAIRQTILNLGVRGKLVPQDPNDGPASELLKRIAADRERLEGSGAIKTSKPLPPVSATDTPFELPSGWAWTRFPEVGLFGRGKSKHRPRNDLALYKDGTYPFIQTGDVARSGGSIETYNSLYNDVGLAQSAMWPAGTLCITIAANIADSGILTFDACFPDSIVGLIVHSRFEDARFFEYFLRTAKADLHEFAPSTAQKNINLGILSEVLIPLPPLAEQRRIVAKVDELLVLCDQLEANLAVVDDRCGKLIDVMLARAIKFSDELR